MTQRKRIGGTIIQSPKRRKNSVLGTEKKIWDVNHKRRFVYLSNGDTHEHRASSRNGFRCRGASKKEGEKFLPKNFTSCCGVGLCMNTTGSILVGSWGEPNLGEGERGKF